jgi:methylase of polypeptide subunit release factors
VALVDGVPTEAHLVGLCRSLGAETEGGPLTADESELLRSGVDVEEQVVAWAHSGILDGQDVLGELFSGLRPPRERRELGAFYTPEAIVNSMVQWALGRDPGRVVDAGCGSGRYAIAVRRAGFQGPVIAVDLDPMATLMTRAHAATAETDVTVIQGSFLNADFGTTSGTTAYLGNPPYVRHHSLPPEVKQWAKMAAKDHGVKVSGLAGLHALFFLSVANRAAAGDIGCFITSSEWMDAAYGQVVRDLLAGPLGLVRLDVVDPKSETFDDAITTAVLVSFEAGSNGSAQVRKVTKPDQIQHLDGGRPISRGRLESLRRWSELAIPRRRPTAGRIELGELFSVKRGIATGANKFFVITPAEALQLGLTDYSEPVVARAEEVIRTGGAPLQLAQLTKVVLDLPVETEDEAVLSYIATGEAQGIHKGYLCKTRSTWWHLGLKGTPFALATYMARQPPVFTRNAIRAANLNTLHGLWLRDGVSAELGGAAVGWLNNNREHLVGGRTYQGGLIKVEPGDMERFHIPPADELLTSRMS